MKKAIKFLFKYLVPLVIFGSLAFYWVDRGKGWPEWVLWLIWLFILMDWFHQFQLKNTNERLDRIEKRMKQKSELQVTITEDDKNALAEFVAWSADREVNPRGEH